MFVHPAESVTGLPRSRIWSSFDPAPPDGWCTTLLPCQAILILVYVCQSDPSQEGGLQQTITTSAFH